MSKISETLEELQGDILQRDLKDNQYLQGSTVPLLDKELKTKVNMMSVLKKLMRMSLM